MEDERKRYKIICPYCNKTLYACKSIAHTIGMTDLGHGTCLYCNGFMKLTYSSATDSMKAEKWDI